MSFLDNINFFHGLSSAIQAVIILIIAFVVAAIARTVVKKILTALIGRKGDYATEEVAAEVANSKTSIINLLANLAYAVVFLLFLPGALQKLGVDSVANPISGMVAKFLDFLPNIIAAVIVAVFGVFLAKLAQQLLNWLLKKTHIDDLQTRYVTKASNGNTFSSIIARFVYVVILIVFIIAALQILNLHAVSEPASQMLSTMINFIPRLFAAIIVILVGIFLARLVGNLLDGVLEGAGLDEKTKALMPKREDGSASFQISSIAAWIVRVLIGVFFVVAGVNILGIETLSRIGTTVIAYLPNILAAAIIIVIAWILAAKASEAILRANEESKGLAMSVKTVIFALAAFMALTQLGIASRIVTLLFAAIVISIAVAIAVAFGVGGRGWAAKKLEDWDAKLKKEVDKVKKDN